jgi:hypothetical protein
MTFDLGCTSTALSVILLKSLPDSVSFPCILYDKGFTYILIYLIYFSVEIEITPCFHNNEGRHIFARRGIIR